MHKDNKNTANAETQIALTVFILNFAEIAAVTRTVKPITANGLFIKLYQLFVKI